MKEIKKKKKKKKKKSTDSTGGSIVSGSRLEKWSFNPYLPVIATSAYPGQMPRSAVSAQMPRSAVSALGMHCLPMSQSRFYG